MYHGIDTVEPERDRANLFVSPAAFAAQVQFLKRRGYEFLTEGDYLSWLGGAPLRRRAVLLTFDDGYDSVLTEAAPILQAAGVPAVCYVCPGMLGRSSLWMAGAPDHQLMSAEEVRRLPELGITVGGHGHDHTAMDSVAPAELALHTSQARLRLQELMGHQPRTFAYPYGAHDESARQAVRAAGFAAAFAVYDGRGQWALPRVDVNSLDTPRTFALKLSPAYPRIRRAASRAPAVRRAMHTVVGKARR